MSGRIRSPFVRYSVAVAAVAVATLLRLPLQGVLGESTPFLFFFPAIAFSGWIGGLGPGLLTTALSALAAPYFFVEPRFSITHQLKDNINVFLFLSAGTFISLINRAWHRARGRAEESKELEQRQRDLLQITLSSIGDAVIATDAQGRITFMNPVALSLTGWSMEEAEGKPLPEVFNIVNELSREKLEDPVTKVLRAGTVVGLANHTVLIAKDGRDVLIDDSGAPIRDTKGNLIGVVLIFRDIGERKKAEQTSALLTAIVESSDSAIIGKKLDGTIVSWNKGAAQLYGYTSEEAIGQPISMLIPPDAPNELPQIMDRLRRGESIDHYETVRRTKDGRFIPILLTVSPINDQEGNIIGASAIARDITERKRAETNLKESEARFRILADSAPVMIWMAGTDKLCNYFNKGWLDFTGRTIEEELGNRWAEGIHPDDYQQWLNTYTTAFDTRQEFEMEYRLRRFDRVYRWISDKAVPRYTATGEFAGYIGSCIDITDRRRAEREREQLLAREKAARKEAEEASRAKDEFLATISHELRTPLNAILGWVGLLRTGKLDDSTKTRALETLDRNARSQAQLIQDMLEVSRIVTGKLRLDVQPVELASVIQLAVDAIQPAADAKGVRLQIMLDPNAGPVSGDPTRLQQVVWNLLSNGVKFTPRGGRVQVRLERINSHVQIAVSDTGQGISADFLPHVFERFRQADSSLSRKHGGLGLGLAIVRHLVELHGGTVEAISEGEGQGSTFLVKLPVIIVHDRNLSSKSISEPDGLKFYTPPPSQSLPSLGGLRLFVVEDESDARELAVTMLRQCGAEVKAAASVSEAFGMLADWNPDVLVSDIEMPVEDGYSFIRKLRASAAEPINQLPAIALTAHVRGEDRIKALSEGFDAHVAKPVELTELAAVILSLARRNKP